jgi:hypothetical protein
MEALCHPVEDHLRLVLISLAAVPGLAHKLEQIPAASFR